MYHYVDLPFREKKAGKYHFNCVMLGKGRHKVIKQILSGLGYDADPLYADSPQPEVKKTDELITENFTPEIHNIDPLYYQIESPKYSFTLVETPEGLENTCQSITQSHVAMLCIPADKVESELEGRRICKTRHYAVGSIAGFSVNHSNYQHGSSVAQPHHV